MSETKEKKEIINFSDRKKVKGAKGSKYLVEGKEYELHPTHADKLIKAGHAVEVK